LNIIWLIADNAIIFFLFVHIIIIKLKI